MITATWVYPTNTKQLTNAQLASCAKSVNLEKAALQAVHEVECHGSGFLASGEPKILFERHIFWRELGKLHYYSLREQMQLLRPDLCYPTPTKRGGYGNVDEQHTRLDDAVHLIDQLLPPATHEKQAQQHRIITTNCRNAALMSCSWGVGQIMGYHWQGLGYNSLQDFINAMYASEATQLDAMLRFLQKNGLIQHLQTHNWRRFARGYNGKNYRKFNYHTKLEKAYRKFKG